MRAEGCAVLAIAAALNRAPSTVRSLVNPQYKERRKNKNKGRSVTDARRVTKDPGISGCMVEPWHPRQIRQILNYGELMPAARDFAAERIDRTEFLLRITVWA